MYVRTYVIGALVHIVSMSYKNIHPIASHKDNCTSACVTMTIKTRIDVFNPAERIKLISRPIPCDISVFVLRFFRSLPYHVPTTRSIELMTCSFYNNGIGKNCEILSGLVNIKFSSFKPSMMDKFII